MINQSGQRPSHHSNANARFYFESSVTSEWISPITTGYSAWDQTNGHQFDFIRELSDTSSNANVSVTSAQICGKATAVGCTSAGADSNNHIIEGTATIKFRSTISTSLRDDVAAHEFGHYAGLGHSDVSSATMYPTVAAGQSSLHTVDRRGRCQIHGHAHGWWGGC